MIIQCFQDQTHRWIKHRTRRHCFNVLSILFRLWPASPFHCTCYNNQKGLFYTHAHTHTYMDRPVVAVNPGIIRPVCLSLCTAISSLKESHSPTTNPRHPPSALLLHDITQSGRLLRQMQPLFSLPVQSLINTEQKVLIQPLIQERGTGNMRGFQCDCLREHQMDVDRTSSQLIIWSNDSLSGCFFPSWRWIWKESVLRYCLGKGKFPLPHWFFFFTFLFPFHHLF